MTTHANPSASGPTRPLLAKFAGPADPAPAPPLLETDAATGLLREVGSSTPLVEILASEREGWGSRRSSASPVAWGTMTTFTKTIEPVDPDLVRTRAAVPFPHLDTLVTRQAPEGTDPDLIRSRIHTAARFPVP